MIVENFKIGDAVRLIAGSKYSSGGTIPSRLFESKLYVRDIRKNGDLVISTSSTGKVTGIVSPNSVVTYVEGMNPNFDSYLVKIIIDTETKVNPTITSRIKNSLKKDGFFTIVDEKDGFGLLKNGLGWIKLEDIKRVN